MIKLFSINNNNVNNDYFVFMIIYIYDNLYL